MAFTFSHAVLAPYLYRLTSKQLPLMPLVIGTMLPDITRVVFPIPMAHHFSGMFSINLLCGGVLCLLWYWLYRPVLYHYLEWKIPTPVAKPHYFRFSILVILALLIGNFSHLFWDSITHLDDRTWFGHQFLAQHVNILGFDLKMHQAMQYGTSLIVLPWLYFGFSAFIPKTESRINSKKKYQKTIILHLFGAIGLSVLIAFGSFFYFNFFNILSIYGSLVQALKYSCLTLFGYLSLFCILHSADLKR